MPVKTYNLPLTGLLQEASETLVRETNKSRKKPQTLSMFSIKYI